MTKLPEPDWITLSESAGRAARAFSAEQSAVETALVAAFHDGKIRTRGRCRSYFKHDTLLDLAAHTWDRAGVVWQGNEFAIPRGQLGREIHIFEDVVVHREDLEKWINGAMPDSRRGSQEAAENLSSVDGGDEKATQPDDETPEATVGRPSRRKEIREAYDELVETGEIDFDRPKTATYEPIRQKVRKDLGDEVAGLGDEAIRIVIAPLFGSAKAARSRQGGEA